MKKNVLFKRGKYKFPKNLKAKPPPPQFRNYSTT